MQLLARCVVSCSALLLSASLLGGCKGNQPKGKVRPASVTVAVGEMAHLSLEFPIAFEDVNHEYWTVKPETLGKIHFDQAEAKRREATFVGGEPGTGTIIIRGLFPPDTKPIQLAEVPVTVTAPAAVSAPVPAGSAPAPVPSQ